MGFIDGYVKSPLAGIAPRVLLAIVSGPGRFEEAASAALGLTLFTLWVGWRRGVPVHTLEVIGAVFFAVLAVLGLVASDDVIGWLETWAGELSNIALAAFAIVTLLIRRPFTMAYAKDSTPGEYWDTPLFHRIDDAISGVWAAAFAFSAAIGRWARSFCTTVTVSGRRGSCRWRARSSPRSSPSSILTMPRRNSLAPSTRRATHRRRWCG